MLGLLATKFYRPSHPAKSVQRPQLSQRLTKGLELNRQVTLVSAPAGFGKTTCICDWLDTLNRWSVAWLSLDPSDDDPGRFFTYFVAALQKVDANLGQEIESVIRSGQLPPSEIISTALINDIMACENRVLLVLDDFHVIQDRFIFQVMEQLVTNFPDPLHLVLITREDPPLPLARLRANNLLTEVRAGDLRFANRDTERFLNEVMGLSLSHAEIKALEDKTEGWVVGLQLAGLSVRERANPSSFIANLSGSHRFILSYLTEQVLDQQPAEIRQFMRETSVLEKLSGDLCNAVSGRSDSHTLLERLFNANLFLIPLDEQGHWYRYHHLFADLLRGLQNTIQKEKTAELHRRASHWYAGAYMVNEAIQHALAAKDYAFAVNLLESHSMDLIMQGFIKTVRGWSQALPDEWASQSPRTNLAFAWMHMLRGDYALASTYLQRLQTILDRYPFGGSHTEEEVRSLKSEWFALQSLMLYRQGKAAECKAKAIEALEILPKQDHRVRSLAYYALASAYSLLEEYPQVVEAYRLSIQYGQAGENPMAEMMSTVGLAGILLEQGRLRQSFEVASQAVARIENSGVLHPISAVVYAALGDAYFQWYQINHARRYLLHALHLSTLGGSITVTIFCHTLLARLFQAQGDLEAAGREIQKAVDLIPVNALEYVRQEVFARYVHICLAQHRYAAAEIALQGQAFSFDGQFSYPALPTDKGIPYSMGLVYNSSLDVLLCQARARYSPKFLRPAIELADRLIARALDSQQLMVALETLLLRAQMHAVLLNHPASRADYVMALELAEPEGFIGVFIEGGLPVAEALSDLAQQHQLGNVPLEYVERILAAFAETQALPGGQPAVDLQAEQSSSGLIESLTEREIDVLRLMAEGLKYKEIAERLFISLNTVRYHVKAIYSKLNVRNRVQAIELARQHRLI